MYAAPIPGTASITAIGHAISADQKVEAILSKTSITTLQTEAGAPCGGYAGTKPGVQRKDELRNIDFFAYDFNSIDERRLRAEVGDQHKMSWEYRGNSGPYYTRTRSVNGRIVREYFGAGEAGRQAADEDRQRREQREKRRRMHRATVEEIDRLESRGMTLEGLCRSAVETELYNRGYHLWHREWRKRSNG